VAAVSLSEPWRLAAAARMLGKSTRSNSEGGEGGCSSYSTAQANGASTLNDNDGPPVDSAAGASGVNTSTAGASGVNTSDGAAGAVEGAGSLLGGSLLGGSLLGGSLLGGSLLGGTLVESSPGALSGVTRATPEAVKLPDAIVAKMQSPAAGMSRP